MNISVNKYFIVILYSVSLVFYKSKCIVWFEFWLIMVISYFNKSIERVCFFKFRNFINGYIKKWIFKIKLFNVIIGCFLLFYWVSIISVIVWL